MNKENKGVSPFGAAVVGAAVGAAAVALANKDNREKVKKTLDEVRQDAEKKAQKLHNQIDRLKSQGSEMASDTQDEVEKVTKEAKK